MWKKGIVIISAVHLLKNGEERMYGTRFDKETLASKWGWDG